MATLSATFSIIFIILLNVIITIPSVINIVSIAFVVVFKVGIIEFTIFADYDCFAAIINDRIAVVILLMNIYAIYFISVFGGNISVNINNTFVYIFPVITNKRNKNIIAVYAIISTLRIFNEKELLLKMLSCITGNLINVLNAIISVSIVILIILIIFNKSKLSDNIIKIRI